MLAPLKKAGKQYHVRHENGKVAGMGYNQFAHFAAGGNMGQQKRAVAKERNPTELSKYRARRQQSQSVLSCALMRDYANSSIFISSILLYQEEVRG